MAICNRLANRLKLQGLSRTGRPDRCDSIKVCSLRNRLSRQSEQIFQAAQVTGPGHFRAFECLDCRPDLDQSCNEVALGKFLQCAVAWITVRVAGEVMARIAKGRNDFGIRWSGQQHIKLVYNRLKNLNWRDNGDRYGRGGKSTVVGRDFESDRVGAGCAVDDFAELASTPRQKRR